MGSSENDAPERDTVIVGLLADPGLPTIVSKRLASTLPDALSSRVTDRVSWKVHLLGGPLPLQPDGSVPVFDLAHGGTPDGHTDLLVCITDLPRRERTHPVLADASVRDGVCLISLPCLGGVLVSQRARQLVVHLIARMAGERLSLVEPGGGGLPRRSRIARMAAPIRRTTSTDAEMDTRLAMMGPQGLLRLLSGMVRGNRPWRLIPSLTDAVGAALAGSSFGLFFSTVWTLADVVHPGRLGAITALAIGVLVGWLVVDNKLWERPLHGSGDVALYNAATLLTVTIGGAFMYVLLFAVMFVGAAIIIPPDYLAQVLGHPVGVGEYASLAWLTSAMGTVAGALGAGLESERAVQEATFSRREQERRRATEERESRLTEERESRGTSE